MKVGLFFGSFNPIHIGHLMISSYLLQHSPLDELWLVLSPHNPHKERKTLADDYLRLEMLQAAVEEEPGLKACAIEFDLPKPSYTVDTLAYLREEHPEHEFVLLMGGDNLRSLPRWKNYEQILAHHAIYVYKRPKVSLGELENHPSIHLFPEAPLVEISATYIRRQVANGGSIRYWVPDAVREIIEKSGVYR